ncbi:unnamed protein product [Moneuplotes crassus]|uniref:Uncharacterized protein n=1 Tax=Euplotes crassus TaxID=5936 RepID=A0AAD2D3R1_EUPCR|nr:unnamed protein product [Moneuplotes crassus]
MSENTKFMNRSRSVTSMEEAAIHFQKLMDKLKMQKMETIEEKKRKDYKRTSENRRSASPTRSISPGGHSPWKRSKIISEEFDKVEYKNMGKISGDVARKAFMLERSYKDPVEKHPKKLANRYSIDFGNTTGKQLSKYGRMAFQKRKNEMEKFDKKTKDDQEFYEKNKRLILNDQFNTANRWNQNVNSREMLISTYKLDKKQLYTPADAMETLKHSITERSLHKDNKFRNTKFQGEYFKVERTHLQ